MAAFQPAMNVPCWLLSLIILAFVKSFWAEGGLVSNALVVPEACIKCRYVGGLYQVSMLY